MRDGKAKFRSQLCWWVDSRSTE